MNHRQTYIDLFSHNPDLYRMRLNDLLTWDKSDPDWSGKVSAMNGLIAEAKEKKPKGIKYNENDIL